MAPEKRDLIEQVKRKSGEIELWDTLGFELKEVGEGRSVFEVAWRKEICRSGGILHGGVLAALIDSACAMAAYSLVGPGESTTSIDLQVSFTRPVSEGRIRAEGKCLKLGRKVAFCEAKVWNEKEDLVGFGTSQFMRLYPPTNA